MSRAEDQKPTPSPTDNAAAADQDAQPEPSHPVPGKDPNEYDPVGMAGKKAAMLQESGEEAGEASKEMQKLVDQKGIGPIPGKPHKKD